MREMSERAGREEKTHRTQLASTGKVNPVQARAAVNDEERKPRLGHHRRRLQEQLLLVVRVVRPARQTKSKYLSASPQGR